MKIGKKGGIPQFCLKKTWKFDPTTKPPATPILQKLDISSPVYIYILIKLLL